MRAIHEYNFFSPARSAWSQKMQGFWKRRGPPSGPPPSCCRWCCRILLWGIPASSYICKLLQQKAMLLQLSRYWLTVRLRVTDWASATDDTKLKRNCKLRKQSKNWTLFFVSDNYHVYNAQWVKGTQSGTAHFILHVYQQTRLPHMYLTTLRLSLGCNLAAISGSTSSNWLYSSWISCFSNSFFLSGDENRVPSSFFLMPQAPSSLKHKKDDVLTIKVSQWIYFKIFALTFTSLRSTLATPSPILLPHALICCLSSHCLYQLLSPSKGPLPLKSSSHRSWSHPGWVDWSAQWNLALP